MICFCFFAKKHIMIYFDDKKQNMRRNQILRILHFGRDGQVNSIVWKQCGTYLTSTVIPCTVFHPSTPEKDGSNGFHSVEFMRLKVSSTLIPRFFHSRIE